MHIHFIGIGGIGVSALAKYYLASGSTVNGSDLKPSEITRGLEELGVKVHAVGVLNAGMPGPDSKPYALSGWSDLAGLGLGLR